MTHPLVVEAPYGPSHGARVMADIGGDVGAMILHVPEMLAGHEIEIRVAGCAWDGAHTAVRERQLDGRVIWAAFFGALRAGRYELRVRGQPLHTVTARITGGQITEASW